MNVDVAKGNVAHVKKLGHALKLIVDQAFERRNIQHAKWRRGGFWKKSKYGKKYRLGLARCSRRGEEQVVFGVENNTRRLGLNRTKLFPIIFVNKILNKRCVPFKNSTHNTYLPFVWRFMPYYSQSHASGVYQLYYIIFLVLCIYFKEINIKIFLLSWFFIIIAI